MAVEWTEELETGIPVIDAQHQEIFRRINSLLEACKEGKGKEAVGDVVSFLEDYVVEHFAAEENIQLHYQYPDYRGHKQMHELFIKDIEALKKKFETEGASLTMVLETNRVAVDWLIKHIKKVDKALADHLRMKGYTG